MKYVLGFVYVANIVAACYAALWQHDTAATVFFIGIAIILQNFMLKDEK